MTLKEKLCIKLFDKLRLKKIKYNFSSYVKVTFKNVFSGLLSS